MENSDRIKLDITYFDAKLILENLKEAYYKACTWTQTNPGGYPPQYGYIPKSKKSRQILSTINYIKRSIEKQNEKV